MIGAAVTPRSRVQAKLLPIIDAFFVQNRRVPTTRELAGIASWSSHARSIVVYRHMVRAGLLVAVTLPGGDTILVPAGRRVRNKRANPSGAGTVRPQGQKRKVKQNQQDRLPQLATSNDAGTIYVTQRGDAYKIGFSRHSLARRVRDSGGVLVLTVHTGQRPSQLEYAINRRFSAKRLPPQGDKPGDKREWFALDESDLDWLRGFACFMGATVQP